MSDDKQTEEVPREEPAPTILTWSVRGISLAMVVGLFAFLVHGAMQPDVGPNFIMDVKPASIEKRRNGWAVPVTITNKGSVAIGDVMYRIEHRHGGIAKEGVIPILGAGESVNTEVWFDERPTGIDLNLQVETYTL